MLNFIKFSVIALVFLSGSHASAADLLADTVTVEKGLVSKVISEEKKEIAGTEVVGIVQNLEIEVLDGPEKGKLIEIESDYNRFGVGDTLYLNHVVRSEDGAEFHIITDPNRMPVLVFFCFLFVLLTIIIGGKQGVRGIASLGASLILIVYVLIPSIMGGISPILSSIIVSSFIIVFGSYITHGVNKTTTSAVIGMIVTVIVTGLIAHMAVDYARLTGFESDEAVYLNFNAKGHIDIVGILLGGIMIGLLGVLYDVAIGQAIAVEELRTIAPHVSKTVIFRRAMRMGREHIGALVNTLAIAYVGASLPLLLLFSGSDSTIIQLLNKEIFATEIIRTLIGSIGLILAVPITTLLTVIILFRSKIEGNNSQIVNELENIEHLKHHH